MNITDTNSFKTQLGTVPEADRLKAAQFVCGVWVAVTLPSIMREFETQSRSSKNQQGIATAARLVVSRHVGVQHAARRK